MTDEEVNRKFDVVAGFLATLATGQQKADERQQKADERVARLERVVMLAIRAGQRERRETRERFNVLADAMSRMAEAQAHTDQRLDALIDIIQEGRNGNGTK